MMETLVKEWNHKMAQLTVNTILVLSLTPRSVLPYQLSDADNLLRDKLTTYNKKLRPIINQSEPITVRVGFSLLAIRELDEVQGKFSAVGHLSMLWIDQQLTWNESTYGGMSDMVVESGDFWVPNVVLSNPFDQFEKLGDNWSLLRFFNSQGYANLSPGKQFVVSCDINIKFYPWDTQLCSLVFHVSGYTRNEVTLNRMFDDVQMDYFTPNSKWEITNSTTSIITSEYITVAVFAFRLKRKSQFIVVNVILPVVIMSFLSVLVFLIPVESGERISYCLTVLLSSTVFLTLIGDSLPKTSSPMPILSWYLLTILCITVMVTLCTVFSLMMYFRDDNKNVANTLSSIVRCLNCNKRNKTKYVNKGNVQQLNKVNKQNIHDDDGVNFKKNTVKSTDSNFQNDLIDPFEFESQHNKITWKEASLAFDKMCCVFFILTLFISTIVFGNIAYNNDKVYLRPTDWFRLINKIDNAV